MSFLGTTGYPPAHADEPLRGPYLQNLTRNSVEVRWTTSVAGLAQLRHFSGGRWHSTTDDTLRTTHRLTLPLDRCTTPCRYRVGLRGKRLGHPAQFRAPGSTTRRLTVLAIGDSGDGGAAQYAVAHALTREDAPILLHLGDLVYPNGLDTEYDAQFFSPYKRLLTRTVVYPALGNHDVPNVDVYTRIFSLPGKHSGSGTERYYSFSYGPLHGIALDSNAPLDVGSTQFEWLRRDLDRIDHAATPWTVVFFHHPVYSSGNHGGTQRLRGSLEALLEGAGVRLILTGHDHDYERSEPGPLFGGTGIVHLVSGGGGNPNLYGTRHDNAASRLFASEHHYLRLRLSPTRLVIDAIRPDGTRIDHRVLTLEK